MRVFAVKPTLSNWTFWFYATHAALETMTDSWETAVSSGAILNTILKSPHTDSPHTPQSHTRETPLTSRFSRLFHCVVILKRAFSVNCVLMRMLIGPNPNPHAAKRHFCSFSTTNVLSPQLDRHGTQGPSLYPHPYNWLSIIIRRRLAQAVDLALAMPGEHLKCLEISRRSP